MLPGERRPSYLLPTPPAPPLRPRLSLRNTPSIAMSRIFQAYKRKTEAAKKEYLKALAAYRASLVSKVTPRV